MKVRISDKEEKQKKWIPASKEILNLKTYMDTKHPENLGHPEITKITETEESRLKVQKIFNFS